MAGHCSPDTHPQQLMQWFRWLPAAGLGSAVAGVESPGRAGCGYLGEPLEDGVWIPWRASGGRSVDTLEIPRRTECGYLGEPQEYGVWISWRAPGGRGVDILESPRRTGCGCLVEPQEGFDPCFGTMAEDNSRLSST